MSLGYTQVEQINVRLKRLAKRRGRLVDELLDIEAERARLQTVVDEHEKGADSRMLRNITAAFAARAQ
jgi:hypothetical protein